MTVSSGQRIDKWLWHARFAKTRTTAQVLARSGRIRINRLRTDSASRLVKIGDVLTLSEERGVRVIRVVAIGERRGPAIEARALYEEELFAPASRDSIGLLASVAPPARPDKRDRRLLKQWKRLGT